MYSDAFRNTIYIHTHSETHAHPTSYISGLRCCAHTYTHADTYLHIHSQVYIYSHAFRNTHTSQISGLRYRARTCTHAHTYMLYICMCIYIHTHIQKHCVEHTSRSRMSAWLLEFVTFRPCISSWLMSEKCVPRISHELIHGRNVTNSRSHALIREREVCSTQVSKISCRSFPTKEPLILGLFFDKWPIKMRHPWLHALVPRTHIHSRTHIFA